MFNGAALLQHVGHHGADKGLAILGGSHYRAETKKDRVHGLGGIDLGVS